LEVISFIFIFILKIHFYVKIKIRGIYSHNLDLDKYYPGHDPEQHSRDFNRQSDILRNSMPAIL